MPGFDKTGPDGEGPMTGRKRGPCAGKKGVRGQGQGRGRGFGRRLMGRMGANRSNGKED